MEKQVSGPKASPPIGMGFFNLAKGFAMILVLYGHSTTPFTDWRPPATDGSWHLFAHAGEVFGGGIMAMFFLISGYGFYKRKPKKTWKVQSGLLLKPYIITGLLILASKLLLALVEHRSFWANGGQYILTYLLGLNAEGGGSLWGMPIESISIFWFILALFEGWLIYNLILQIKDVRVQNLLIIGVGALGCSLGYLSSVWPYCLPLGMITVWFLGVGEQIRDRKLLERPLNWKEGLFFGLLSLICLAFGQVDMVRMVFRLWVLDLAGSIAIAFLLLKGYCILMRQSWIRSLWIVKLLESFGYYSILILTIHAYEKVVLPWYRLAYILPGHPTICTLICLLARILFIGVTGYVINKGHRYLRKKRKSQKRKGRPF